MAIRRMFSKTIVNSDKFLDMPASSQLLYFHLGINADDDGFVETRAVMNQIGSNADDLNILLFRGFCLKFEDGVIVIRDWKVNNEIRVDRYRSTFYVEHKKRLTLNSSNQYVIDTSDDVSLVVPNSNQLSPNGSTVGLPSIGKVRLGEVNTNTETLAVQTQNIESTVATTTNHKRAKSSDIHSALHFEYQRWITEYNTLYQKKFGVEQNNLKNFFHWRETYSLEDMISSLKKLPKHTWLSDKHNPGLILRQTDRSGNPVDRIGELLSYREKSIREQLEEKMK